jgi:hypothetical protein
MDQEQRSSRNVYPKLPATFTEIDLPRLFGVTSEEWAWAKTVARRGPSMVALLTHLKVLQHIGLFGGHSPTPSASPSKSVWPPCHSRIFSDPL